jgi:hypothetical protein
MDLPRHGVKELNYFTAANFPPRELYLSLWPQALFTTLHAPNNLKAHADNFSLLDVSPLYMMQWSAAPRAKAIVPHAKIVVLLRVRHQTY